MGGLKLICFKELKPCWELEGAKQPGFMRWLVHYVSGEEPVFHANREKGAISKHCKVGLFVLPVGQRQRKHYHQDAEEIYVLIRGKLAVEGGDGSERILEPFDCLYNPPGTAHAVRNCGLEDAVIVFVDAPLEAAGRSVYVEEST